MKVWELRTEQVTMICVSVGVRRERRENLAGERGRGQGRRVLLAIMRGESQPYSLGRGLNGKVGLELADKLFSL